MSYYIVKQTKYAFEEAIARLTAELQKQGFGVLTEIDVRETLKKKLNVDFRRYKILGACHPPSAYQALQAEEHIGLMLPCNVTVQEKEEGAEVAAIDPLEAMARVGNDRLAGVAAAVRERLVQAIQAV